MTRKKLYNAIRWILLVPVVGIINIIIPIMIANAIFDWYTFGVQLILTTLLAGITGLISRIIAPKHKDTISMICAIIGFICTAFFLYVVALAQGMSV